MSRLNVNGLFTINSFDDMRGEAETYAQPVFLLFTVEGQLDDEPTRSFIYIHTCLYGVYIYIWRSFEEVKKFGKIYTVLEE